MDLSVKAVVPALCARRFNIRSQPTVRRAGSLCCQYSSVTATALFASQNVVVDVDNTASLPVRWYPANTFLPRRADSRLPSSHGDINAASVQCLRVVVIKPDTGARTRTAAHQDRAADAQQTLALMFNEKTPATKPTIKRRDGMKLREKRDSNSSRMMGLLLRNGTFT
ncbi:Uncharacterised protein [Escherichia coli]|uniref:Uncharacterized protein n=1 Tax=Escherichia coli TaxID=562 RepID=A0A376KXT3_ECOLX|nr:Uncharacterised protein [Escherichia coli]